MIEAASGNSGSAMSEEVRDRQPQDLAIGVAMGVLDGTGAHPFDASRGYLPRL
jgi:hypothetical protein